MSKQEFAKIMKLLEGAYYNFSLNDHQKNTWYEFLGEYKKDIFEQVVREYICENPKAPSISDFYTRCKNKSRWAAMDESLARSAKI